jgi:hypothetical protein
MIVGSAYVVVATLVQIPRQSGSFMWRTVWAEDGQRFYADALSRPLPDTLFDSYAGYAHLVPRLLAWLGARLPPEDFSIFVTVAGALSVALITLFVYFASAPLLRSRWKQGILAGALLLWPVHPFEITGTITNIQWVLPVACLLAVLLPVKTAGAIAVRVPIVVLGPLSSPLCVLFAPIAIWHVARSLSRRAPLAAMVVPVVYLASALGQLVVWWISPQTSPVHPSAGAFAGYLARLYGTRVTSELLLGVRVTENAWETLGYLTAVISTVAVAAVLVWRFVRSGPTTRWIIGLCTVASVGIFAVSVWQRPEGLDTMLPVVDGDYSFAGLRYQLFPAALLLLALLVPRDLEPGDIVDPHAPAVTPLGADLGANRVAVGLAAIWVLVAFVPSYRLETDRSGGPDWIVEVEGAEESCEVDPDTTPVVAFSPGGPTWVVAIPCPELSDDRPR